MAVAGLGVITGLLSVSLNIDYFYTLSWSLHELVLFMLHFELICVLFLSQYTFFRENSYSGKDMFI